MRNIRLILPYTYARFNNRTRAKIAARLPRRFPFRGGFPINYLTARYSSRKRTGLRNDSLVNKGREARNSVWRTQHTRYKRARAHVLRKYYIYIITIYTDMTSRKSLTRLTRYLLIIPRFWREYTSTTNVFLLRLHSRLYARSATFRLDFSHASAARLFPRAVSSFSAVFVLSYSPSPGRSYFPLSV